MQIPFLFLCAFFLSTNAQPDTQVELNEEECALIIPHTYQADNIVDFFEELVTVHIDQFEEHFKSNYYTLGELHDLNKEVEDNYSNYYTLMILHELFTAQSASNYSHGAILDIPYLWHWSSPNPRHSIQFTKDGSYLKETSPPSQFSKYNSFADIDRTPSLFLSDLFTDVPKYMSVEGGKFSSFGWCSEREMAFVCLVTQMGFESKVIAQGAHSWTECLVSMSARDEKLNFIVRIDNTFDETNWYASTSDEVEAWRARKNDSSTGRWYDRVAHSEGEKRSLRASSINNKAKERIELDVVEYLNSRD